MSSNTIIERSGRFYEVWRLAWPYFSSLSSKSPGPLGLAPPIGPIPTSPSATPTLNAGWFWNWLFRNPEVIQTNTEWDWWEEYTWGNVRRIIASGNGEILHGTYILYGLLASIAGAVLTILGTLPALPAGLIMLLLIAVIFWNARPLIGWTASRVFYLAYRALGSLSAQEYADIVLRGRRETDVLRALAYEMRAACQEFAHQLDQVNLFFREQGLNVGTSNADVLMNPLVQKLKNNRERLTDCLRNYERQSAYSTEALRRLIVLEEMGAEILGISRRRLCDHILEYSCTVHLELSQQFTRTWERILSIASSQPMEAVRLAERAKRIQSKYEGTQQHLQELFRQSDLNVYTHRIASRHSTSGVVQEYAAALRHIANNEPTDPPAKTKRLRMMFRIQKAYSGLDIHETVISLCAAAKEENDLLDIEAAVLERQCFLLREIAEEKQNDNLLAEYYRPGPRDDSHRERILQQNLEALALLPNTIEEYLAHSRRSISNQFWEAVRAWLDKQPSGSAHEQVFVLTHGYSKTVRDILKGRWEHRASSDFIRQLKIFVMTSSDEEVEDARKMVYELEEELPFIPPAVASGDEGILIGLAQSDDRVVILLGAECFDSFGRVVHPRGARQKLIDLRRQLHDRKIPFKTFVVAERYKRREIVLNDYGRFRDHYDRLDVYSPDLVDEIITNQRRAGAPADKVTS